VAPLLSSSPPPSSPSSSPPSPSLLSWMSEVVEDACNARPRAGGATALSP
jgi:hypothetical protein